MRRKQRAKANLVTVALAALMSGPALAGVALAFEPTGACCLAAGGCDDLLGMMCEDQGGTFLGDGTSCRSIACDAPLAVPMLSIVGLVAAVGGLGGFGLYRLLFRPQ
jgi:hypothetical protein